MLSSLQHLSDEQRQRAVIGLLFFPAKTNCAALLRGDLKTNVIYLTQKAECLLVRPRESFCPFPELDLLANILK